jgi:hypothetical protein
MQWRISIFSRRVDIRSIREQHLGSFNISPDRHLVERVVVKRPLSEALLARRDAKSSTDSLTREARRQVMAVCVQTHFPQHFS